MPEISQSVKKKDLQSPVPNSLVHTPGAGRKNICLIN